MKKVIRVATLGLGVAITVFGASSVQAQNDSVADKTRQRTATTGSQDKTQSQKPTVPPGERLEPDDVSRTPSDVPVEAQANRHQQLSEEAEVVPYYNNFFSTYRLGPEDVISVSVFGHERYSRGGIIVPPSGRISLALIPGGIFVVGKTVDEVAEQVKKRYDEYIIDPQVTVTLEKGLSYRYSILGDVAQPGIRLMSRRMTVTEAISEAGGVLQTGNKSGVVVLRRQPDGMLAKIPVNVSAIYKGRAPDTTYLVPGDQIVVPGNKLKTLQTIMNLTPIMSFARVFGIPF